MLGTIAKRLVGYLYSQPFYNYPVLSTITREFFYTKSLLSHTIETHQVVEDVNFLPLRTVFPKS